MPGNVPSELEIFRLCENIKRQEMERVSKLARRNMFYQILDLWKRNGRAILFYGLRGIGKTTSMLQAAHEIETNLRGKAIYLSGDIIKLYNADLLKIVREIYRYYKRDKVILLIDEVQWIKRWDLALKIIYDSLPRIKIVATGSSAISLAKGSAISRRYIKVHVPPLTFREYLKMKYNKELNVSSRIKRALLKDLQSAYLEFSRILLEVGDLEAEAREFLYNSIPLALEDPDKIPSIVDRIETFDLPMLARFDSRTLSKFRDLLHILATSNSGEHNPNSLSSVLGLSRNTVEEMISSLQKAELLNLVQSAGSTKSSLSRPPKVLFSCPAIRNALAKEVGFLDVIGGMREDAVVSAALASSLEIKYPKGGRRNPDYLIRTAFNKPWIPIEVGGPSKGKKQLKKGIIVREGGDLEFDSGILYLPLSLFLLVS